MATVTPISRPQRSRMIDAQEVRRAYDLLTAQGQIVEIRALDASRDASSRYTETLGGYFDNFNDLLREISSIKQAMGIYITLHPCHTQLLHRAKNKLVRQKKDTSTPDKYITGLQWLAIDSDPDRVSLISSDEEEHQKAIAHSRKICQALKEMGWPDPIECDSGNGGHLLYRINLPPDDSQLVKRVLEGLSARFDEAGVHVDKTLFNPARIIKLYGTLACKGDNTDERPHRLSRILEVPDQLQVVSRELLEAIAVPAEEKVAAQKPAPRARVQPNSHKPHRYVREDFTLDAFIAKHGIKVKSTDKYQGGTRYLLEACAWDSDHTDDSACLFDMPDGLGANCSHNSCEDKHWRDYRLVFEPDAYSHETIIESFDEIIDQVTAILEKKDVGKEDIQAFLGCAKKTGALNSEEQGVLEGFVKSKTGRRKEFSWSRFKEIMNDAIKDYKAKNASDEDRDSYAKTAMGMMYFAGDSSVPISNFGAEIVADVQTDDGAEQTRSYEINAELVGRKFNFEVPARDFAKCDWVDEQLGARARITTGNSMKSHLINAIKSCSEPEERFHYAHTGWRKIDEVMVYLHAGGCLGQVGQVRKIDNEDLTQVFFTSELACRASLESIKKRVGQVGQVGQINIQGSVKLTGSLTNYSLTYDRENLQQAIQASLRIMDVTKDEITAPLYSAIWRAPLGEIDFGLHLAGKTGHGKSELVALAQQHYGASMSAKRLPGSWESTENSLEMLLFQAADTLVSLDDFKPKGGKNEQARLHAKADRIFRQVGNKSARGRLDAKLNQRIARSPRCLVVSTGEDVPIGQSVKARCINVTMDERITAGESAKRLTEAQRDAMQGLYVQALAGYIEWLAPNIEGIQAQLPHLIAAERDRLSITGHARSGTNTANLLLGMKCFLQYACEMEAITPQEAEAYLQRCESALINIAGEAAQADSQDNPSEQWRRLIVEAIAGKKAHLTDLYDKNPGLEYGWRVRTRDVMRDGDLCEEETFDGGGDKIGWIDGDDIYLIPAATYNTISKIGNVTTSEYMLNKILAKDGLLASTNLGTKRGTITVRPRRIPGRPDVLHVKKNIFFSDASLPFSSDPVDPLDPEPSKMASEAGLRVGQVFDKKAPGSSDLPDPELTQQQKSPEPEVDVPIPAGQSPLDLKDIPDEHHAIFSEYCARVDSLPSNTPFWRAPDSGYRNETFGKEEHKKRTWSLLRSSEEGKIRGAVEAMKRTLNIYENRRSSATSH